MTTQPKKRFGGKQEGAGRKPKAPSDRLNQVAVYVDSDTLNFLRSLPRAEAVALKREAASVLKRAEIESRII